MGSDMASGCIKPRVLALHSQSGFRVLIAHQQGNLNNTFQLIKMSTSPDLSEPILDTSEGVTMSAMLHKHDP